jgi:cell division septum initiation protein DivIVA
MMEEIEQLKEKVEELTEELKEANSLIGKMKDMAWEIYKE